MGRYGDIVNKGDNGRKSAEDSLTAQMAGSKIILTLWVLYAFGN